MEKNVWLSGVNYLLLCAKKFLRGKFKPHKLIGDAAYHMRFFFHFTIKPIKNIFDNNRMRDLF